MVCVAIGKSKVGLSCHPELGTEPIAPQVSLNGLEREENFLRFGVCLRIHESFRVEP